MSSVFIAEFSIKHDISPNHGGGKQFSKETMRGLSCKD